MSWSIGFDFRSSMGYVTDPAGCVGIATNVQVYPYVSNGVTYGWIDGTGYGWDINNTWDPRLAGSQFKTGGTFRVDLPAPGDYLLQWAFGSGNYDKAQTSYALRDGATTLQSLTNVTQTHAQYYDATNVLRTSPDDWVLNNASRVFTFAGTELDFDMGFTFPGSPRETAISHLYIEQLSSGPSPAVLRRRRDAARRMRGAA